MHELTCYHGSSLNLFQVLMAWVLWKKACSSGWLALILAPGQFQSLCPWPASLDCFLWTPPVSGDWHFDLLVNAGDVAKASTEQSFSPAVTAENCGQKQAG